MPGLLPIPTFKKMIDLKNLEALTGNIGDMALKRRVVRIITELEIQPADVVLDCGCGDGLYLKTIGELERFNIIGFDLNADSLRLAQDYVNGMHIPVTQGSIHMLPFRDSCFNKVFSTEVIEHIQDDCGALKEILRILKPGGMLIITVPNHNYPFLWDPLNWILERFTGRYIKSGFWAGIWNMHLRLYYKEEIESLVKKAGFRIALVECVTHYCLPFNHILLYALKKLLTSGMLPERMSNTADKFLVKKDKQSRIIKLGYKILGLLDKLNNRNINNKSSVAILIKAFKNEA